MGWITIEDKQGITRQRSATAGKLSPPKPRKPKEETALPEPMSQDHQVEAGRSFSKTCPAEARVTREMQPHEVIIERWEEIPWFLPSPSLKSPNSASIDEVHLEPQSHRSLGNISDSPMTIQITTGKWKRWI